MGTGDGMRPTRVRVHMGEAASFDIHVVCEHFASLGEAVSEVAADVHLALLLEDGLSPSSVQEIITSLEQADFELTPIHIPAGNTARSLEVATELYDAISRLMENGGVSVVCVGGQACCDVAAFVCATLVGLSAPIMVPTTFSEMLQAHIDGRCIIDIPAGRGLVHSQCLPLMVYDDLSLLKTLDDNSFEEGCVRLVRAAALASSDMPRWLAGHLHELLRREAEVLQGVTLRSIDLEASMFVSGDSDLMCMGDMPAKLFSRMLSRAHAASDGRLLAEGLRFVVWLSDELFEGGADGRLGITRMLDEFAIDGLPLSDGVEALPDAMRSIVRSGNTSTIVLEGLGKPRRVEMSAKALEDYVRAWLMGRERVGK